MKKNEKQVQKLYIQTAFLVSVGHLATATGYTLNNQFSELMTDFSKEYSSGYEG